MTAVFLQLIRQIHDADGFEGAFLDAYSTTAAQFLRDYGFAALHANGFDVAAHHRTESDAVLVALLDLAAVSVENSDTSHSVSTVKLNGEL
jgi:hypothetical protein